MVSSEFDLGMKPEAPNSRQWRMTARSSFPDTITTGVDGRSDRRNSRPENPRTPGMFRSSSTRSVSGAASSAAAMLSKSCATTISAPGAAASTASRNPPTTSG